MKRIKRKRLARMWCELNAHKTPVELEKMKWPENKKPMFKFDNDHWGAMILIESLLTKREITSEWRLFMKTRRNKTA